MVQTDEKAINSKEKKSKQKEYFILIDGHAIAFRAYYALSRAGFRKKDGTPTWAVYGFARILFEIINNFKPKYLAITFDTSEPTFRHEMYDGYKADRGAAPDDFSVQMPFLMDFIKAFEIPIFSRAGFEADDLIGTLARQAGEQGMDAYIISGDQDLIQLINERTTVFLPNKNMGELIKYDINAAVEKYGVRPDQFVDYKAIIGDKSDCIPGIPGMGPKKAVSLLNEFGSLQGIYDNLDKIKQDRIREMLEQNKDIAFFSQRLAQIDINAPVELEIRNCHLYRPDMEKVKAVLEELEFRTIISSLPKLMENFSDYSLDGEHLRKEGDDDELWFDFNDEEHTVRELDLKVNVVSSAEELQQLADILSTLPYFSIDLETTGVNSLDTRLVGFSLSHDKDVTDKVAANFHIYYVPVGHILEEDNGKNIDINEAVKILKPVLENEKVLKIGHNIKYEINVLSLYGIEVKGIKDDTIVADYLVNSTGSHALKEISKSHLHYFMTPISELIGTGKNAITMDKVSIEKSAKYAGADSAVTLELSYYLRKKLEEDGSLKLYEEIELPLVPVLARMEQAGIGLDKQYLDDLSERLRKMIEGFEKKIIELAGREFNVSSPKQLSTVLFDDLKIPTKGIKQNKTTGFSTDAGVLEKLAPEYEIVKYILEYRQLTKLKSTYSDSLPKLINPRTGNIHTSFNQTVAVTGRLSSTDPNLQNIPIKTEIGREIRRAFIPSKREDLILTADYSQIELRLLTHYTKDPVFTEAFKNDLDIHSRTVMDVLGLKDISEVTPEMRRMGKTINFGIIYGQTVYGLSEKLNIPNKEAKQIIEKFNEKYKSIAAYVDEMVSYADKHGYVKTLFNRRRYLPEIHSSNRMLREFGKRTAINTPLQGTAADIIKIAMIRIDKALIERKLKTKMLLQVHDELVFEVPKNELEEVRELIREIMENVCPEIDVPLKVSVNIGDSWVEAK